MTERAQDPRPLRSRAALEAALRELIAQRPLSRISVSDVTKHAGVNRSTFYEHYADVADLAASACTAVFDELVAATPTGDRDLPPGDGAPPGSRLADLFSHVAEHAPLYRALLGEDGSARVHNHLLRRFTRAVHAARATARDEPAVYDPAAAFVAGALLGVIVDWLEHDRPVTPGELGAALRPQLAAAAEAARAARNGARTASGARTPGE
ncbi:TetR/AcrR family transcriptional regulator [Allostreptomyces psammosilenae]|uniref:AcrR family transcriptional regulator n=1 Tax=Allostreptomyces psammosilenae TaxID=1892865 RepID=A0A852ZQD8_9ACTN|nr:TetR/AcrR family transcriptional regulator C-terminal domain-containing protein [Allostreptomyces psammosilenae]NYI04656.1 AcrR family transcriptional regulator [Allostreptomyces psammosilenae]